MNKQDILKIQTALNEIKNIDLNDVYNFCSGSDIFVGLMQLQEHIDAIMPKIQAEVDAATFKEMTAKEQKLRQDIVHAVMADRRKTDISGHCEI